MFNKKLKATIKDLKEKLHKAESSLNQYREWYQENEKKLDKLRYEASAAKGQYVIDVGCYEDSIHYIVKGLRDNGEYRTLSHFTTQEEAEQAVTALLSGRQYFGGKND